MHLLPETRLRIHIRGDENVQLLKPRQRVAKRLIDPLLGNVRAQQRVNCCVAATTNMRRDCSPDSQRQEISQFEASLQGERM
jgi:hypothetical protein